MNKTVLAIGIIFLLIGVSVVSSTGYIATEPNTSGIYFKMDSPTVLLDENFSGTFPPEGWSTDYWEHCNLKCGGELESPCACLFGGYFNSSYITSKAVDASPYKRISITFRFWARFSSQFLYVFIKVRMNETSPWIDVSPWAHPLNQEMHGDMVTIDLYGWSSYGDALQVNWTIINNNYFQEAYLDDVLIYNHSQNNPPTNPIINGPTYGKVGVEYTYTFNSTYECGHNLIYVVNWGDGSPNEYLGPVPPGVEVEANHTWNNKGTYVIRAKAMDIDEHGVSGWSELQVIMPRDKATNYQLLLRLLERFPLLQRLSFVWRSFIE